MWILPLLGYVGVILGFGFLTLAIGMFCLAKLWNEWSRSELTCDHSFRPLLPLRTRRRTHRPGKETLVQTYLRRRWVTSLAAAGRWLPHWPQRAQRRVACHICAELAAVSDCEVDGSAVLVVLWYATLYLS
jgi:hypothetical protein